MWLLFLRRNKGILAFLKTRSMVFANLTYLDSLNRYIVLCPYKALMGLSEKSWFLLSLLTAIVCVEYLYMNKMWLAILCTSLVIVSVTLLSNASSQVRKITLFGEPKIMIHHDLSTENIKNKRDDITSKIIFVNSTMENKK
jgi:hypothetical protein